MTQPAEEQRGGDRPDWDNAFPGQQLPERQQELVPAELDLDLGDLPE